MRHVLSCLALAVLAAAAQAAPVPPQTLSRAERDSLARALAADRLAEDNQLKGGATSYLAAVNRVDFGPAASLVVGRAPGCDVRVDDPEMPERAVTVTVVGDSFRVQSLDPAVPFRVGDRELRDAMLPPVPVKVGRWTLRLSHQRFPAIIVMDPKSPRLAAFRPIPWYAPDFAYRFVAPLQPNPAPDTFIVQSTRGNLRRAVRVGWFELRVGGKPCRLEACRLLEPGVDEKSLSIFFRDATTGRETYPVGRYLDPELRPDGLYLLDFNLAYNPACAFSPHYNCPIPSRENTLKIAIRAGAKDPHLSGHSSAGAAGGRGGASASSRH